MFRTITASEMKEIEERAHSLGYSRTLMMENAGRALADEVCKLFRPIGDLKILVLCGTGNNGGDGAVAARHLAIRGYEVKVVRFGTMEKVRTEEAKTMWKALSLMKVEVLETEVVDEGLKNEVLNSDVILDAMLGTGVKGEVREPFASAIDAVNKSKALVVAVDIPSGLDPDTGVCGSKVVKADVTVTFHAAKPGLLTREDLVGKLIVAEIGIPL
jgi:NAD(P)H-hydrate epimerase